MVNKKQNDARGWKNKLEGLDSLPGEAVVEKTAAWEKLHARLQNKPRSRKAIWYWAAAAILLVLMIPVLLQLNKENNVKGNTIATEQPKIKINPDLPVVSHNAAALVTSAKDEKKPVIINNARAKHVAPVTIAAKENKQEGAVLEAPVQTKNTAIITAVIEPDTVTAVAVAAPLQKKMKIVHINDLESFPLPFYSSGKQAQKAFKIKIGNSATNQSTPAAEEYTNALQIKIPFKN